MKDYFKSAIAFYYKDLLEKGCDDPVKVIIADFINTVKITKEQQEFIHRMSEKEVKMLDNLLVLIAKMKIDEKYDSKSFDLVEKGLKHLKGEVI